MATEAEALHIPGLEIKFKTITRYTSVRFGSQKLLKKKKKRQK
jgi:hypothetical protein